MNKRENMSAAEFQPHVSSVHDGHDQTQLCFCLEGVSQGDNEPAVNSSQDPLLHHRPLQDRIRTSLYIQLVFSSIFDCRMRKGSPGLRQTFWSNGKIRNFAQESLHLKTGSS